MATMNSKRNSIPKDINTTVNHEGMAVHNLNALESLFSKVLGSFFGESTFYEKKSVDKDFSEIKRLISEVSDKDIEYVLKIAEIGRQYNMITYPLALLTACFNDERFKYGRVNFKKYSGTIIRRGKDILDIMAMQLNSYTKPLPKQFRKCLKWKLETFNEYQLSKSLGTSKEVSLADCIKLLRPNAKVARVSNTFYKDVIEGKVKFGGETEQIQSAISKAKNSNNSATKETVKKSINTSTLQAVLKNLVALYRQGIFEDNDALNNVVSKLTSKKEIEKSRLLPFRFYSAYTEVSNLPSFKGKTSLLTAISKALDMSIYNLKDIDGYNAILVDRSGSMQYSVSGASNVTADLVACILAAITFKKGNADVYVFGTSCEQVKGLNRSSTIIDLVDKIRCCLVDCGTGTCIDRAFCTIYKSGVHYDNLIIFSDNECYTIDKKNSFVFSNWWECSPQIYANNLLKRRVVKKIFIDNLLGNNFAIVNTNDYRQNLITGFSERVIDIINVYSSLGSGAKDIRKIIDSIYGTLEERK